MQLSRSRFVLAPEARDVSAESGTYVWSLTKLFQNRIGFFIDRVGNDFA